MEGIFIRDSQKKISVRNVGEKSLSAFKIILKWKPSPF